jgi:hypothetical protein
MASSTFTFDAWDDVIALMERFHSSAAPSPSVAASTPWTQSSGEFQPFSLIGSVLFWPGGGGSKKTYYLCLPSSMEGLCLGLISGTKFCL